MYSFSLPKHLIACCAASSDSWTVICICMLGRLRRSDGFVPGRMCMSAIGRNQCVYGIAFLLSLAAADVAFPTHSAVPESSVEFWQIFRQQVLHDAQWQPLFLPRPKLKIPWRSPQNCQHSDHPIALFSEFPPDFIVFFSKLKWKKPSSLSTHIGALCGIWTVSIGFSAETTKFLHNWITSSMEKRSAKMMVASMQSSLKYFLFFFKSFKFTVQWAIFGRQSGEHPLEILNRGWFWQFYVLRRWIAGVEEVAFKVGRGKGQKLTKLSCWYLKIAILTWLFTATVVLFTVMFVSGLAFVKLIGSVIFLICQVNKI